MREQKHSTCSAASTAHYAKVHKPRSTALLHSSLAESELSFNSPPTPHTTFLSVSWQIKLLNKMQWKQIFSYPCYPGDRLKAATTLLLWFLQNCWYVPTSNLSHQKADWIGLKGDLPPQEHVLHWENQPPTKTSASIFKSTSHYQKDASASLCLP